MSDPTPASIPGADIGLTVAERKLILRLRQVRKERPGVMLLIQVYPMRLLELGKWEYIEKTAESG